MAAYANLHFALEKRRIEVTSSNTNANTTNNSNNGSGPRVMIIGPDDAGKTSLIKLLTGYAIRQGRKPCVVNLDPREGVLSLPGTLTATSFSTLLDVEEGFGTSPTSGPSPIPVKLPLVYYFGSDTPEANPRLYKKLAARLALAVTSRLAEDADSAVGGALVDTPGYFAQPAGYELVQRAVADLGVDVLVVLGSERLYSDMLRRYPANSSGNSVAVVKLAKSGGCVDREEEFLRAGRNRAVKEYFFGEPKRTLSPHTITVIWEHLVIYRIAEGVCVCILGSHVS